MKMKIELQGDAHEDRDAMLTFMHTMDLWSAVWDARQEIRTRIKHGQNISTQEEKLLKRLQEILYVEGLEW